MAFIGNTNTTQAFTPAIDYFSGNGSTTAFTLSRPVASVAQVQVTIDNVAQNPSSAFTVSANTITFTSAPLSGTNNIYVYYTSPITQVIAPGQGTVTTTSLTSGLTLTSPIVSTTMGVGGATPSTSGSGITFPATQSASTDANTLDDYEEGTWTPADTSGASLSFTISGTPIYTKIGNLVTVNFFLSYPSTANGTGNNIGGLPFSIKSSTYALPSVFTNSSQTLNIYYDSNVSFSMRTNGNVTPANSAFSTKFVSATITYMTT